MLGPVGEPVVRFTHVRAREMRKQTLLRIGINGDIYGGMRAPLEVGTRRVDIAYVNPAALVAMAYRGKGYYKQKLQLRVLGCFPSWDRIALVVDKNLGVKSLHDIARRKIPLRVSTRFPASTTEPILRSATILSLYGLSFDKIKRWGGKVQECGRPFSPERLKRASRSARSTRCSTKASARRAAGWTRRSITATRSFRWNRRSSKSSNRWAIREPCCRKAAIPQLKEDALTIDYSGWSLVTHRWLPNSVAYAAIETIDERQKVIPVDDDQPLDMRNLCRGTEKCPLQVPLHPGAAKYYKDEGISVIEEYWSGGVLECWVWRNKNILQHSIIKGGYHELPRLLAIRRRAPITPEKLPAKRATLRMCFCPARFGRRRCAVRIRMRASRTSMCRARKRRRACAPCLPATTCAGFFTGGVIAIFPFSLKIAFVSWASGSRRWRRRRSSKPKMPWTSLKSNTKSCRPCSIRIGAAGRRADRSSRRGQL